VKKKNNTKIYSNQLKEYTVKTSAIPLTIPVKISNITADPIRILFLISLYLADLSKKSN